MLTGNCYRCACALFTFVSLDDKKNVQTVPQLLLQTEEEQARFEQGQLRYETKKSERQQAHAQKRRKAEI